jgi:hypothetical protein
MARRGDGRPGRRRGATLGAILLAAALALGASLLDEDPGPVAQAEAVQRYSGRVLEVDLASGRLVVEELGRRGVPVRRQVRIDVETPLVTASRLRPGDMRGANAYGEVAVSLADVLVGDFVVVEAVDLDGDSLARRVTIVETR